MTPVWLTAGKTSQKRTDLEVGCIPSQSEAASQPGLLQSEMTTEGDTERSRSSAAWKCHWAGRDRKPQRKMGWRWVDEGNNKQGKNKNVTDLSIYSQYYLSFLSKAKLKSIKYIFLRDTGEISGVVWCFIVLYSDCSLENISNPKYPIKISVSTFQGGQQCNQTSMSEPYNSLSLSPAEEKGSMWSHY